MWLPTRRSNPAGIATRLQNGIAPLVGVIVFFGIWELFVRVRHIKTVVLPRPSQIGATLVDDPGFFAHHAWVTGRTALIGLSLAFIVAIGVAVPMSQSRFVERAVQPIATLIQVIPLVCYAPIFAVWLGFGTVRPIIAVTFVICLVPIIFGAAAGLRSADSASTELLYTYGATRRQVFRHVSLPSSLPYVLAGVRTSVGLALVGAVLGEYIGASEGLGVQISKAINGAGVRLGWAAAFTLGLMGGVALAVLTLVERRSLHWHASNRLQLD